MLKACVIEQGAGGFDTGGAVAIGEKSKVADLDETVRENVQAETPGELEDRQRHCLGPGVFGVVLIGEGDR